MAFFCCSFSEGVTQSHPLTYLPKTSAILSFTSDIEYFRGCNLSFRRYIGCFGAYNLSKRYDAGCFTGYNLCFRDYIGCFSGYDLLKDRMGDVLEGCILCFRDYIGCFAHGDDYSKKPFALWALPPDKSGCSTSKREEHLMAQTCAK